MGDIVKFFAVSSLYVSVSYLLNLVGLHTLERFVSIPLVLFRLFGPRGGLWRFLTGVVSVFFALAAIHRTWPVQEGWWLDATSLALLTGAGTFILGFEGKYPLYVSPILPVLFYLFRPNPFPAAVINYLLTVFLLWYSSRKEG